MQIKNIERARQEAADFIVRVNDLLKFQADNKSQYVFGSSYSAALRRKSMELTRSLAKMRKP